MAAAQFVLQLDFSIVNVALPTIQRELRFTPADLQWIVTGYAMTFGSLLLLGGRLGDLGGRRRIMLGGLVAFAVTSVAAGLAQSPLWLVASRVAQGASAALVAPAALAMVSDIYPDGPARTRAMGIFQGSTAAGASAGIVLGGLLTQYVGWRAIFLVNPPIIAVLATTIARTLPAGGRNRALHLDVPGALAVTVAIAALIYGLSQGQQHGFSSGMAVAALILTAVTTAAFIGIELRSRSPMLPFAVLADSARCVALAVMLLTAAVVSGYVYFVSLYLQRVLGFTALLTGLGLVPSTLTVLLTSTFLTRRLLARFPGKLLLVTGLVILALGQVWLATISAGGSYQVNVLGGLVLTAFGMGLVFPVTSIAATARMAPDERGLAGGLFATCQQVGQAIGLAALATIAAARTAAAHGSLTSGYQTSFTVAVGIVVAAILLALLQRSVPDRPTD